MAKMRGLLSRPKIDPEELAQAQSRAAARLADLAERRTAAPVGARPPTDAQPDESPDSADAGGMPPSASSSPGPSPAPRPPIVVEGATEVAGAEHDPIKQIDVMARLREEVRDEGWHLPLVGGLVPAVAPRSGAPAEAQSGADASPPMVDDGGIPSSAPRKPPRKPAPRPAGLRPPTVVEADADAVGVGRESAQAPQDHVTGPVRDDASGETAQLPIDGGTFPAVVPPAAPIGRPGRVSSRDNPLRPSEAGSTSAASSAVSQAFCPYCALLLLPAPVSSQRCARCRQRIIVKHIDGRAVYLTEAAVPVFVEERRRVAASGRLTRERERWLRHAAAAGAPSNTVARLAGARLTEGVVGTARTLYLTTVDRAFRAAKREHDWETASRFRREKATVLYRVAGSPLPPPADLIATFREGVVAELRGIAEISREAELRSASCCDTCRADDRLISRIAHELRVPRLPHSGCPRGLCRCRWDLAERDRTTMRRYLRRRPRTESRPAPNEPAPA